MHTSGSLELLAEKRFKFVTSKIMLADYPKSLPIFPGL